MSYSSKFPLSLVPESAAVKCLPTLQPYVGELAHLPTRAEAQALLTLADAYVLELPVKNANDILVSESAVDQVAEKDKSISLSHLRRFAKSANLPRYVQDRLRIIKSQRDSTAENALKLLDLNQVDDNSSGKHLVTSPSAADSIFLLVGLTRLVQLTTLKSVLDKHGIEREIFRTRVPISPPMNPTLAREWSDLYWPTQYRKSTPLGPHPTVIRQGTETVTQYSGFWISQVMDIARKGFGKGFGPAIGALIVDSKGPEAPAPVAIAADARYGLEGKRCAATGNVMNHAVMRAIGLIGRKRMSLANPPRESPQNETILDYPLLDTEQNVYDGNVLPPGGYLCTGLDIYLTHEPCIMCAQAILHSRFDKVIFRRRMSKTGAATPERPGSENAGLGYGLFWRPELNWRLLVWEWRDKTDGGNESRADDREGGVLPSMHA